MGKFSELLKHIKEGKGKTSEENDHYHTFEVNDEGNGKTDKTIGGVNEHVHEIEEFDVKEAKGHDHDIPSKKPKVNEIDAKKKASEISRFFLSMDKKKIQNVIDVIDQKADRKTTDAVKMGKMVKDIRDQIMSNINFGLNDIKAGAELALKGKK